MNSFSMDSLKKDPFASFKGKKQKLTRELLLKELTRRGSKGYLKLNLDKLIDELSDYPLNKMERDYISQHVKSYVDSMSKTNSESEEESQSTTNYMSG